MAETAGFTIIDVAKAAGVSVSTVSRILNGKQDVAQATRERVQQIIEDLGYAPHAQAQHLRAGRTRNIALLFPLKYPGNLSYNALEMEFIVGAAAGAAKHDFLFSLMTSPVNKQSLLSLYRSAQVDALILMHIHAEDWRVELLRENDYPFVMIGHCADNTGLTYIDLDFKQAVMTAFDHITSLGHRTIGFLGLPSEMHEHGFGPAMRGWEGYRAALRTHQLAPLYREVNFDTNDIFQATLALLDQQPDLTAIVTTHELAFRGILEALKARGRSVPEDCSLIALMTEKIADLTMPAITYLDFPAYSMGYQAVDMLIRRLENDLAAPEQILIAPRLVSQNSTLPIRVMAGK